MNNESASSAKTITTSEWRLGQQTANIVGQNQFKK